MKKCIMCLLTVLCLVLNACGEKKPAQAEKMVLTLAVFQSASQLQGSNLSKCVNRYQKVHPDIKIEIINYMDNCSDLDEAINQIKIEINAGKGPDLINFGGLYSPLDASCGMLLDLNPFLQGDDTFDPQEFYTNILNAFAVGEELYILVPDFRIESFVTDNSRLAGLDRMNMQQLSEAYHSLDEECILFPGETKKSVFGMMCYGSLENYIDWDQGTCSFYSDSFKELLNFADQFPLNLNISEDYSTKNVISQGHTLLYPASVDSVYAVCAIAALYGKEPTYIGYPFDLGSGNMAAISDIAIGISVNSQNKEEAWSFLRSTLDSDFQDQLQNGLPIRVSSLEQKIAQAMTPQYDANGEKIAQYRLRFEGEEPLDIYEVSAEDAETLKSLIRSVEFNATVDDRLYNIILEEVDYLFHRDRDVDEVADIIQNRVSTYIQESK